MIIYLLHGHAIELAKNVFFFKGRFLWAINVRIKVAYWRENLEPLNVDWVNSCYCLAGKFVISQPGKLVLCNLDMTYTLIMIKISECWVCQFAFKRKLMWYANAYL